MKEKFLIDTDVVIDHLRGYAKATSFFLENKSSELLLSVMTIAELHVGIRNQAEQTVIDSFLRIFKVIPVDDEIAAMGGHFRKKYKDTNGTGLTDAIIAATALQHHAKLVTLNARHYPMVKVKVPYKKTI